MADPDSRAGTQHYGGQWVREWVDGCHKEDDAGLLKAFASGGQEVPAIQLGAAEGGLLSLLVAISGARKIVEVGTLAGYSALWMARAMPAAGRLVTIELDPKHAMIAERNILEAGMAEKIEVRVGAANDLLPQLSKLGPFDLVFLDADKAGYLSYGRWARQNLRSGGLLVADNAYFFGRLLEDTSEAAAVRGFHEETSRYFDSVCVPTPDGLVVARLP